MRKNFTFSLVFGAQRVKKNCRRKPINFSATIPNKTRKNNSLKKLTMPETLMLETYASRFKLKKLQLPQTRFSLYSCANLGKVNKNYSFQHFFDFFFDE